MVHFLRLALGWAQLLSQQNQSQVSFLRFLVCNLADYRIADGVDYVMITCETATLTHYYVVRDTDSTLHMATFTTAGIVWLYQHILSTLS